MHEGQSGPLTLTLGWSCLLSQDVELWFSLSDPLGLNEVYQLQHLTLQFHQLGARLPEASIGLRALLERFELFGLRCDVLSSRTAAVGEHLGMMQMALGTTTIWFSATPLECVDGTGQERISFEEDFLELPDALSDVKQLCAEGTERLGHGGPLHGE